MNAWSRSAIGCCVLGFGAAWTIGGLLAATTADPFANEPDVPNGIAMIRPANPRAAAPVAPPQIGNPLWAIPLSALAVTQDRPVFAPSRRPPPRAVAAVPMPVAAPPPPLPPPPPEPLQLSLIGAVVGNGDAIAVFVDRTTQGIVRMRMGQVHAGWSLTSIQSREATLSRNGQVETTAIQRSDNASPAMQFPGGISPATGVNYNLAPTPPEVFVPRSTPKNGTSDGL